MKTAPRRRRSGPSKVDAARETVNFAWVVLAVLFAACHPPRATPPVPPGEWTSTLGGVSRSAYAGERLDGELAVAWSKGVDRGFTAPVHMHGPIVVATTSGRSVVTLNAATGMQYWSRRFNGPIAGGALRRDDRIYLATGDRENKVHALDIHRGRGAWSRRVGTVRVEPLLLASSLIVVTEQGDVVALDAATGSPLWRTRIGGAPAVAPVVANDHVLVATARDTLFRIEPATGTITGRLALPATPSAAPLVADGRVVIPLHSGSIVAVSPGTLEPLWTVDGHAVVLASPVRVANDVFVLDVDARISRIDPAGRLTSIAELGGAASGSFAAVGNRLVAGRLDGRIFVLEADGHVLWSVDLGDSIVAPVAVMDGALYVPLLHGSLVKLH